MQVSLLAIVDPLKEKLLQYPELVDRLKNKEHDFLDTLQNWMTEMETILKNNNIAQCSEIAGLRSKIIAPVFDEPKGRSTKKRQFQIASESMYQIQSTILSLVDSYEEKISNARDLLRHLLGALKHSGAINFKQDDDFESFIRQIWNLFTTHEQSQPSTVQVLSLVSRVDALRIIAEEINLTEWR